MAPSPPLTPASVAPDCSRPSAPSPPTAPPLADAPALSSLHAHLGYLLRAVEANAILSAARPPSAFADLASVLLDSVSWPGPRPADSTQFQALQRWQRLLDEIALLDFDGTLYSWRDFVDLLDRHAQETIFAPESHDAPIQIMGPFESSGQQFDALWFMGVDDTAWPPRTRLHPLLPAAVQRQFSMPHAARDDNWNLARTVTTRLLNSAPRIVFSYAQRDKDAELRPSPLIASLFSDIVPQPAGDFSRCAPSRSVRPWSRSPTMPPFPGRASRTPAVRLSSRARPPAPSRPSPPNVSPPVPSRRMSGASPRPTKASFSTPSCSASSPRPSPARSTVATILSQP